VTPEAALSLGPVTELESSTVEPSRIRKIAMGRPLNLDHLHNFGIGEVMKRALSRRAFLQRTAAVGAATLIREVVLATRGTSHAWPPCEQGCKKPRCWWSFQFQQSL